MPDRLQLRKVVFYGRSLEEYRLFFNLDDRHLAGRRILDCPAGTASFCAEASHLGARVVGLDPGYALAPEAMADTARADIAHTLAEVRRIQHVYRWGHFRSLAEMEQARYRILERFLCDLKSAPPGRYLAGKLPSLPFADGAFDLVLSGHLLFIYEEYLDFEFHCAAIREMLRVGGELRLFPVAGMDRQPWRPLGRLQAALASEGITLQLEPSREEFAAGWNTLAIARRG